MTLMKVSEHSCSDDSTFLSQPQEKIIQGLPALYLRELLGEGPVRFALRDATNFEEILQRLNKMDRVELDLLQKEWKQYCSDRLDKASHGRRRRSTRNLPPRSLPIEWYFRFLNHCANDHGGFDGDQALHNMTKILKNNRYVKLRVFSLQQQLESKTLFPVPGLKTSEGLSMFYMRPSRYFPNQTTTKTIINNLTYVMNTMLESSQQSQKNGIGFLACMDDWKMKNFDVNYCFQFMMGLQGAMIPVKVQLFLIVNPPTWFGAIWQIMKPMLLPSFRRKVKIVKEDAIGKYLQADYLDFLPDDMSTGSVPTDELVSDFITYRRYVERADASKYGQGSLGMASEIGDDETQFDQTQSYDQNVEIDLGKVLPCSGKKNVKVHTYCDDLVDDKNDADDASIEADIEQYNRAEIYKEIDEYFMEVGW
ncbi:MAG: hypothetical protein SGILL_007399 [Bacillariaceae sp.]